MVGGGGGGHSGHTACAKQVEKRNGSLQNKQILFPVKTRRAVGLPEASLVVSSGLLVSQLPSVYKRSHRRTHSHLRIHRHI